jgi:hypothetical protein
MPLDMRRRRARRRDHLRGELPRVHSKALPGRCLNASCCAAECEKARSS